MTEPIGQAAPATLPEIPECDVERLDDGGLLVRHRETGNTATAATVRDAELAAIKLRTLATYERAGEMRPLPLPFAETRPEFRAGYLP